MTCPSPSDRARAFVADNGWANARYVTLPADASTRRYHRLSLGAHTALLMVAASEDPICPPQASNAERVALGWNAMTRLSGGRIEAFAGVAAHLRSLGLSAPRVIASDTHAGLALVEDFGDRTYASQIADGADENELYAVAAQALAVVHRAPVPQSVAHSGQSWPILTYDALALRSGVDLFVEWVPRYLGFSVSPDQRAIWSQEITALIDQALTFPRCLILRDYHAENLIWINSRNGIARSGMIDFQDAIAGWGEWDMDMLVHDARRTVSDEAKHRAVSIWLDQTGDSAETFDTRIAVLGTLNALRILGVFCRLIVRDGKTRYTAFLPRQRILLAQRLQHPATRGMATLLNLIAPEPM